MRSVLPWSWSSYDAYQTCPRKFYETRIAKNFVEAETDAIIWGNQVHKAIELYVKEQRAVPDTMQRFIPLVDKIKNAPGHTYAEMELACTVDLKPTGFWDADAWCRGKGDILKVNGRKAFNGDWKTGKWKEGSLQLDLMAVMTFAMFEEVETCSTAFIYFQQPSRPVVKTFTWDQVPSIMAQFEQGVADMVYSEQNNVWPEKPSGLCKAWCPVRSCKYFQKGSPRRY